MKKCWLYNKTVVISGASGGIGFNVAKILIQKYDCTVIGIARNEEKLLKARETLQDKKDKFLYKIFDVNIKENWENFAKYLTENSIKIDILFNNAGFMLPFTKLENLSDKDIEDIINTNFKAYVYSIRILLPLLKQSSTPSIINLSSVAGICAVVGESMYCATKFAVKGLTETLIQDYKGKIYVAGIYPGFIRTNILHRMSVNDKENKLIQKVMMPVEKATSTMVRKIARKKKKIVVGLDGNSMNIAMRLFGRIAPNIVTKALKLSKLDLFNDVFD